mgnify:CR=1 FL=1
MDMERLTEKLEEHGSYYYPHCFESGCDETSGLCICEDCSFQNKVCQKLGEYEDLEEQGKLLKLPCAVGDTVYTLNPLMNGKTVIGETTADAFFCALGMLEGRFGKTIFLTKEEAEAALEKLGKGEEPA